MDPFQVWIIFLTVIVTITNFVIKDCLILSQPEQYLVSTDASGKLVYKAMLNGDTIMDFSAVGYKGKDDVIPSVAVMKTFHPSGGDDTNQIQAAINEVSSLPLDKNGFRGAVKLAPGTFNVGSKTIVIQASGVVIQGSGISPQDGTVLNAHGLPASVLFRVGTWGQIQGAGRSAIITATIPSGSKVLIVDNSTGFHVGDKVQISIPWTAAWIQMMGMTELWKDDIGSLTTFERVLSNVSGSMLILDVAVPTRIDQHFLGGNFLARVQCIQLPVQNRISNVGIQDLMALKEATKPTGTGSFIQTTNVEDAWFSNMVVVDFGGSVTGSMSGNQATVWISGSKITVERLNLSRTIPAPSVGIKPFDIALETPAQQILVRDTHVAGDNQISLLTNNRVQGPNVFFNCKSSGVNHAQPHAFFATGLLYDNVDITSGSLDMINRGLLGSGQGYGVGYGVAYNCSASAINVINPPGSYNWALGCTSPSLNQVQEFASGEVTGVIGPIDPSIPSLYQVQLRQQAASTQS